MNARCALPTLPALAVCCLLSGACSVVIEPNPGNGNGGSQEPPPEFVTIRFINESPDAAVQVEFYATNEPLEAIPDELFADDTFLVRANIGLAGSGLIGPRDADEIEFECTDELAIGTRGGEFRDNETGEVLGRGDEVYKGPGGFSVCGGTVVFTFSEQGGGFRTRFAFQ